MTNVTKKIEVAANVAIIVVALLLGVVLVRQYLLPGRTAQLQAALAKGPEPGTKLSLPGVDWGRSRQTLVMVLSTNCHFCTESAPFYQKLAREKAGRDDVRLIAVLPQSVEESQKYLGEHGVSVGEVRQAPPDAVGARGTPTLIIVDGTGSVVESWVGKIPAEKEAEVLGRILGDRAGVRS